MKIGIIQNNPLIGDFAANADYLLNAYQQLSNDGADIVISPELSLVGYPPLDLIFEPNFIQESYIALQNLAKSTTSIPLIVGSLRQADSDHSDPRPFNSAFWLIDGEIQHYQDKSLLATYDVFNEKRYFRAATKQQPFTWNNIIIGLTICEDIWHHADFNPIHYSQNPLHNLKQQGAELILNISASPFYHHKPQLRSSLLAQQATFSQAAFIYVNTAGAQDELIFDGGSQILSNQGQLLAQAPHFSEGNYLFDVDLSTQPLAQIAPLAKIPIITQSRMDYDLTHFDAQAIHQALLTGIRNYVKKCGFKSVCLGLSGGVDSALVATLATQALGAKNVYTVMLPSQYSSQGSLDDAQALANNLGINCREVSIQNMVDTSIDTLNQQLFKEDNSQAQDLTEQNLQARIRGLLLMAYSNQNNHLLLTTGNKSEISIGYCTLYGDMCGGLNPIGDLLKTEVYALCDWINRDKIIIPTNTLTKAPSAELKPNQTDQDSLPDYSYLDALLHHLIVECSSLETIQNIGFKDTDIQWAKRQIHISEWKRNQSAIILKVSEKSFGKGRIIPLSKKLDHQ